MRRKEDEGVVMAIAVNTRGFGYIVFESRDLAMAWGVREERKSRPRDCVEGARMLLHMIAPSVVVMEDVRDDSCRRGKRAKGIIEKIAKVARDKGIKVVYRSRAEVRAVFDKQGVRSKRGRAEMIVKEIPQLADRLPPARRAWESEHFSMGIFEAAALALTYFDGLSGDI